MNRSVETSMEEIKPVVTKNYEFEYRDNRLVIALFDFGDYKDLNARNNLSELSIHSYSLSMDLWIETLMEEIKLVVGETRVQQCR